MVGPPVLLLLRECRAHSRPGWEDSKMLSSGYALFKTFPRRGSSKICDLLTTLFLYVGHSAQLDNAAQELNISRQAVIKTLIRQALDQHYLAASRQSIPKL